MGDSHVIESETVTSEDDYWPLSGKPHFDIVLSRNHISRKQMFLPRKLLPDFPSGPCVVPAVLTYCHKSWNVSYHKSRTCHAFYSGIKAFLADNDLKVGDACVFELLECSASELKFRVQILRGDFPSELLRAENGETPETAIIID